MTITAAHHDSDLDLTLTMATFSAPGAGMLAADPEPGDDDDKKGPVTFGTTCWGTPCPSANTISC